MCIPNIFSQLPCLFFFLFHNNHIKCAFNYNLIVQKGREGGKSAATIYQKALANRSGGFKLIEETSKPFTLLHLQCTPTNTVTY